MTIKEFAQRIGVSTATVSRAIHGRGRISSATREMILRRMEELGFTPNLHAQNLAVRQSRAVGLECLGHTEMLTDMFLIALARGIQQVLSTHGYQLLLNPVGVTNEEESLLRQWISSRAVDGVVIIGDPDVPVTWLRRLFTFKTFGVVVVHHPPPPLPHVGCVMLDLSQGLAQAAELLGALGHRQIGVIGSTEHDPALKFFVEEVRKSGGQVAEEHVLYAGQTPEDGARAMQKLLRAAPRPTAVFVRTDVLALGAMQAAREAGIDIPRDISLVAHDDVPFAQWTAPPLTTVRIDYEKIGKSAVEMLLAMLRKQPVQLHQTVHTYLVQRATASPPMQYTSTYKGG